MTVVSLTRIATVRQKQVMDSRFIKTIKIFHHYALLTSTDFFPPFDICLLYRLSYIIYLLPVHSFSTSLLLRASFYVLSILLGSVVHSCKILFLFMSAYHVSSSIICVSSISVLYIPIYNVFLYVHTILAD